MSSPNMPRLPWERSEDGRFIAYPNGRQFQEQCAWLRFHPEYPKDGYRWVWVVTWEGRFDVRAGAAEKQEAADLATECWWTSLERTEGWRPSPPPPPPSPEFLAEMALRQRLGPYLRGLDDEQFHKVFQRYLTGDQVEGSPALDLVAKSMCAQEWHQRLYPARKG